MTRKSELLKELGWNDDLIQHFMIEDSDFIEEPEQTFLAGTFETHQMTIKYNAETTGSHVVLNQTNE